MLHKKSHEERSKLVFLCVDESIHALRALEWFRDHFYRKNHVVGIVHIHPPLPRKPSIPTTTATTPTTSTAANDNTADRPSSSGDATAAVRKSSSLIQDFLNKCVQYGMKVKLFSQEKNDSVGKTICNMIKEHEPSCLVMGQRGLGTVKRTIYGSVSEYVLHHAHIPVVIVPPPPTRKLSNE